MLISQLRKYRKILILGYGIEGRVTEEFLKKYHQDCQIIIGDQKYNHDYLKYQYKVDLVVKSPSIIPDLVKKSYTTASNIFFANTNSQLIGITGTKGKSTTASLVNHILLEAGKKSHLAGNIGSPMLSLIGKLKVTDYVVLELSSYQLSDIKYSPHIGCLLNIYPEHFNYHKNFTNYFIAKAKIAKFCSPQDYFIYNPEFKEFKDIKTQAKKIPFYKLSTNFDCGKLIGKHNYHNIQAAYTITKIIGISDLIIQSAISQFKPLKYRLQDLGIKSQIKFINDAASSNPISTIAAIKAIPKIDTIIIGGQNRGYDFSLLVKTILVTNINNIILFPDTQTTIEKLIIQQKKYPVNILKTDNMKQAVKYCYQFTKPNKTCLLSTGAPSYSIFKNFIDKGEQFNKWVFYYDNKKADN